MTPAESILQSLGLVGLRVRYTDPVNTYTLPEAVSLQGQIDAYLQADNDNAFYALDRALWTTATTIPTPTITLKQFIQSFLSAVAAVFQARGLQQVAEQLRFQNNIDRILGSTASRIQKYENDAARQAAAISRYLAVMPGTTSIIPNTPSIVDADFTNTAPANTSSIISNIGLQLPSILAGGNPAPALPTDFVSLQDSERIDAFLARLYINMISDSLLQINTGTYGASGSTTDEGTGLVDTLKDILVTHAGGEAGTSPDHIGSGSSEDVNSILYDFLTYTFQPGWEDTVIPAILSQSATWSDPRVATFGTAASFALPSIQADLALVSEDDQDNYLSPVRTHIVDWTNALSTGDLSHVASDFYTDAEEVITDYTAIVNNVTTLHDGDFYNPDDGGAGSISSPAKPYSAATAYTTGQCVLYNGLFYKALQAGTNKNPETEPAYWVPTIGIGPYWDGILQDGSLYTGSPNDYIVGEGSSYFNTNDGLFYKARFNIFTVDSFSSIASYDNSHTYAVGDVVNSGGAGSYYQAIQAGSGHTPTGESTDTYWKTIYVAENFSPSNTYYGFDIVYDPGGSGDLYRCIAKTAAPGTDPTSDTTNWQKITFGNTAFFSPQSSYQFQMGAMMKGVAQSLANMGTQLTEDYVGGWDNTLDYDADNIVGKYNTGTQTVDYYTVEHDINQTGSYSTAASYVEGDVFIDSANQRWIAKSTAGPGYNATAFNSSTDYAAGSVVSYTGNLYVRNATVPSTFSTSASYSTNEYVTISSQSYKVLQDINYQATLSNITFAANVPDYSVQDSFIYSGTGKAYLIQTQSLTDYTGTGSQYASGDFVNASGTIYKRTGSDPSNWSDTGSYSTGDYVKIGSEYYELLQDINYQETFNSATDFRSGITGLTVQDSFIYSAEAYLINNQVIEDFTGDGTQYATDDFVIDNNIIYKRNAVTFVPGDDLTPGADNSGTTGNTYWTAYTVADYIDEQVADENFIWLSDSTPPSSVFDNNLNPSHAGTSTFWTSYAVSDFIDEQVTATHYIWLDNPTPPATVFSHTPPIPTNTTYWSSQTSAQWANNHTSIFEQYDGPIIDFFSYNSVQSANLATIRSETSSLLSKLNNYMGGFVPAFSPLNGYTQGTYVFANDHNYLVKNGANIVQKGAFDSSSAYKLGEVFVLNNFTTWTGGGEISPTYDIGDYVAFGGSIWECLHTSVNDQPRNTTISGTRSPLPNFSQANTYTQGECVLYNGDQWQCDRRTHLTISTSTQTNPVVITTSDVHGLSNGDTIYITGANVGDLNETSYTVANVTDTTFELSGIDGTAYDAYTGGGVVTGFVPSTSSAFWTKITPTYNSLAIAYVTTYDGSKTYASGSYVTDGTHTWKSTGSVPVAQTPDSSNSYWSLVVNAPAYAGGTTYYAGDYVTHSGNTYRCIAKTTGNTPPNATYWTNVTSAYTGGLYNVSGTTALFPQYWNSVSSTTVIPFITLFPTYTATETYTSGQGVTYGGDTWQALRATTGQTPVNGSPYWSKITSVFDTLAIDSISVYDSTKAYQTDDFVTDGSSTWQSVAHTSVGSVPSVSNDDWNLVVFAPNYAAGTYYEGQYVIYSGQTWKCLSVSGTASTPSEGADWTQITSGVVNLYHTSVLSPAYGPQAYSYSSTYSDGDIVFFSDQLWQRTSEPEPANFSNTLPVVDGLYYQANDVFKFSGGATYFQLIPGVNLTYRGDYKLTTSAFSPTDSYSINNVVTDSGISYLVSNTAPATGIFTYSALTAYTTGQHVYSGGYVWKALQNSTGQTPLEGDYWTAVTTDSIPTYSGSDTYYTGDYVYYSNSLWRVTSTTPISPTNSHVPTTGSYWNLIDTLPIATYSSGASYTRGDYVYDAGTIYQAIVASTGQDPAAANNAYWQAVSHKAYLSGSARFQVLSMGATGLVDQGIVPSKGIISPTVDYLYGDTVSVSGQVYQLTADTPALEAYDGSTAYTAGQYVTYGNSPQNQNDVYLCIQSGTGQTPVVGGNSSYWTKSTINDYVANTATFYPLYKTATLPFPISGSTTYAAGATFTYKDKVYVTVSPFTTPNPYRSTQSYSIGSYIYQGGTIWQAIKPSASGGANPPSNSSIYWTAIPFEEFLSNSGYFLPLVEHDGYIVDTNTGYAVDLSQTRDVGDVFVINGNETGFTYVVNSVSSGLNAYSPNSTYVAGNFVSYGGSIWKRSSSAFPAGISQPPGSGSKYWTQVSMNGYLSVNDLSVLNLPTNPPVSLNSRGSFNAATAYAVGDAFINGTSTYVTVNATSGLAAYSSSTSYTAGNFVSHNGSIWQRTTTPLAAGISSSAKQPQQPGIYWTLITTDTYINNSGFFNRLVTAPNNLFLDVSTPSVVPTGSQNPYWNDISDAKWIFNDVNSSTPHFSNYTTPVGASSTLPSFFFEIDPVSSPTGGSPSIIDAYLTTLSCSLTGYQGFLDNLSTTLTMLENFVGAATSSSDFATIGINMVKNILKPLQGMLLGDGVSVASISSGSVSDVYDVLADWSSKLNTVASSGVGTRVAIAGLLKTTIDALLDLVTSDAGHTFQGNATRATTFRNASGTFYAYVTTDFSGIQSSITAVIESIQNMFSGYVLNPLGTFQSTAIDALTEFVDYFENTFKTLSGASMNVQIADAYFNLSNLFEAVPQALKYRIESSGTQLSSVLPLTAANQVQVALRYVFDTLAVPTYQVGSSTEKTPASLRYYFAQHYYEYYLATLGPTHPTTQTWLSAVNTALTDVGGPTIGSSGSKGYLANLYDAFTAMKQQILMPSENSRLVCATNGNSLNYLNTSTTQASLQAFNGIKNSIVNLMNGLDSVLTRNDFIAPPKVLTGVQKLQNDLVIFWGNNLKDSNTYPVANLSTCIIDFINNTLVTNQEELVGNNTPTALPSSPTASQIYATLTSWNSYLQTSNVLLYNVIQTVLSQYFVGGGSSFALPANNDSLISVVQTYASNQYIGPMSKGSQEVLSSLSAISNTASTSLLIAAYKNFIQDVLEGNSIQLIGVEQQNQIDPIGDSPTQAQAVACLQAWKSALDHTTSVFTSYDADRAVMSSNIGNVITEMLDYNNGNTAVTLHGGDGDASLTTAVNAVKMLRATSEVAPILAASNTRLGNDLTHLAGFPGYYAPFRTELTDPHDTIYGSDGASNRYGFDAFNAIRPSGRLVTFKTTRDTGESDINLATNTITAANHGFQTGDAVIFDNCGMSDIGNLVTYGTSGDNQGKLMTYYIKVVDANSFQLTTTRAAALDSGGPVVSLGSTQPAPVHTNVLLGYNNFDIQPYVIRSDFIQYSSSTSTAAMSLLQIIAGLQNFFSKIQPVRKYGIADVGFYDYGGGEGTPLDFTTWGWLNGRMTDVCYNLYVPVDLFTSLFGSGGKMRPTWLWSCNYVQWEMESAYYAAKNYYQGLTNAVQQFNNQFAQFHLAVELNVTRWMSQAFATTSVIDDVMYRIFEADPVSPQESRLAAKILSILLTIIVAMLASNPTIRDAVMRVASLGTATADSYSGVLIEVSLANAMIQRAAAMAADLLDRERAAKSNSAEYIASNPVSAQSLFDLASFYQTNKAQQKEMQQNIAAQRNLAQP